MWIAYRDYGTEHVIVELDGESKELEVCVLKDSGHSRVHRIKPILNSLQSNLFTRLVLGRCISIKLLLDFIFRSTLTVTASKTFRLGPHVTTQKQTPFFLHDNGSEYHDV